jgi:hypothetical protein
MLKTDRVAVAGDWHVNTQWACHAVNVVADAGLTTILHLGDFAIWPGRTGLGFRKAVSEVCARRGVTIYVTPGNHEDWDQITAEPLTDLGDGIGPFAWFTEQIAVLPRGHRFSIVGSGGVERTFLSLGGAPSIDYQWRRIGSDWWINEAITDDDVARVTAESEAAGPVDVMLTHDAPEPLAPTLQRIVDNNPGGYPIKAVYYAAVGRERLTRAFDAARPSLLFHGHYHMREGDVVLGAASGPDPFTARIESLNMDGESGNLVALDIATLAVTDLAA